MNRYEPTRFTDPAAATNVPDDKPEVEEQHDIPQAFQSAFRWSTEVSNNIQPEMGPNPRRRLDTPIEIKSPNPCASSIATAPPSRRKQYEQVRAPMQQTFVKRQLGFSAGSPANSASSDSSEELFDKLLSTSGYLGVDNFAGTVHYFGPTTNLHVFWNPKDATSLRQKNESSRRAVKVISELSVDTYDHLMGCFWRYHNSIFKMVERYEFNMDKENGATNFFSSFLQLCMLALGFRFADKSRPDIKRLMLPYSPRESTLHREAKKMVEYELENLGGIPSIQAWLLLGDLECGCGRDNTGWLFGGIACHLCAGHAANDYRYGVSSLL